jgi:two-component system, response regulator RegA
VRYLGSVKRDSDKRLLLIEPSHAFREELFRIASDRGFHAEACEILGAAVPKLARFSPTHVLIHAERDHSEAFKFLRHALAGEKAPDCVVSTLYPSFSLAVAAIKIGATDYSPKPTDAVIVIALLLGEDNQGFRLNSLTHPDDLQMAHVCSVLKSSENNITHAAQRLRVHRRSLQRMLRKMSHRTIE